MCGYLLRAPYGDWEDLTCNPGMCPDWESNQQRFGSQAGTQPTELHQLRQVSLFEDEMITFKCESPTSALYFNRVHF